MAITRRHDEHASRPKIFQQALDDHGVGDVDYLKLIQTQHPHFSRQRRGVLRHSVHLHPRILQFMQFGVRGEHE